MSPVRALANVTVAVDRTADRLFEPTRHPAVTRSVARLSHLGDGGAIWVAFYALRFRRSPRAAIAPLAALAVLSALVNGPVKALTKRSRPEPLESVSHRPLGSSFPSGHAFSSVLVASMLPDRASRLVAAAIAAPIASSRVHLRYHHLSDVVAGVALGLAAGRALRGPLHRAR